MPAAHMDAAHVRGAATHMDPAATAEVSTAPAATAEVSTATTASAGMCTAAAATTAASRRISSHRQTKGKAYCDRACRDFPHDTTSSSGPNA
jgi:hypothetical protein